MIHTNFMPPEQTQQTKDMPHRYGPQIIVLLVVAIAAGLFGAGLAHSNSDYTCTKDFSDTQTGSCTNGSWSDWTTVNSVLQRVYTGTMTSVVYSGSEVVSCSHPTNAIVTSKGTTTIEYASCQIQQTGTTNNSDNNNGNATSSTITTTSSQTTVGQVSTSTTLTGSYQDYLDQVDAALATLDIHAIPALVSPGATTQIFWATTRVTACKVSGSNGDGSDGSWTGLQSPAAGETTSGISGQTIYTLTCNVGDKVLTKTVTVNVVPKFNEN
jgi:hypothetical protein